MFVKQAIGCAAVALALAVVPARAAGDEVERVSTLDATVSVEGVRSSPSEVAGRVVNETGDQLEDVRLLVADDFHWTNERHPGPESPAEAHTITVAGPIPPHGSATFRFERPSPLPDRSDGEFHTDVSAIGAVRRPVGGERSVTIERSERRVYKED